MKGGGECRFTDYKMLGALDSITELYSPEIQDQIERWNYPSDFSSWEADVDEDIYSFIKRRPCIVINNIEDFFDITFPVNLPCDTITQDYPANNLQIAPNPTDGNFFLYTGPSEIENGKILIIDMSGKLVYKEKHVNLSMNDRKEFRLPHLDSGLNILQIISKSTLQTAKLVIR